MISIEPGTGGFDMPVVLQYVPQFDTPYYVVLGMSIACITSAIGLHVHLLFGIFAIGIFHFTLRARGVFWISALLHDILFHFCGCLSSGTICALFLCLFIFG
jgi:hypothetical protein